MPRRLLITGTSGRLGRALARRLSVDYEIVQLDVAAPTDPEQGRLGPVFVGSVTDPGIVAQAMDAVDAVIHSAAIPWSREPFHKVVETNVVGTFVMLEEAGARASVEQFIYISSIVWHGLNDPPREDHLPEYLPFDERHPSSAVTSYAGSKVQAEEWCRAYVQRFKKPAVALRPSYIVQPNEEATFTAGDHSYPPHLNEYVATSDLVDLIRRTLDYHPHDGFDVFLANAVDQRTRIPSLDLAEEFFPNIPVDREKLAAYDGFGALVDCTHAREVLGWLPKLRCKR